MKGTLVFTWNLSKWRGKWRVHWWKQNKFFVFGPIGLAWHKIDYAEAAEYWHKAYIRVQEGK